ncbi:MAG: hypothetical protein ABJP48_07490 [Erythrobacter sp.]
MAEGGETVQAIIDLVENVTSSIRVVFMLLFLAVFGVAAVMTAGASFVAPKVVGEVAERAERANNRAIDAAEEARRNNQLAREGWGYGSGDDDSSSARDDWGQ